MGAVTLAVGGEPCDPLVRSEVLFESRCYWDDLVLAPGWDCVVCDLACSMRSPARCWIRCLEP